MVDSPQKSPLITVAMSVYNGGEFLIDAVNSILNQTYNNFEFVIVDDGSTDNSLLLLREFESKDSRIRLIARENKNLATSLNEIVSLASGEWIARMDQDDISLPNRFERQLIWLNETSADICGTWVQFFGSSDKRVLKHAISDEAIKSELMFGSCFAHPSVMVKTSLLKSFKYDPSWEKCEDYDLWERLATAGFKMTNVPEVLLKYRQHSTQISSASSIKQFELSQKIRLRYLKYIFQKLNINDKWASEIVKLRDSLDVKPNIEMVDVAFNHLLRQSQGEQKDIIFDHATRLYFRVAADYPDIVDRWSKLNNLYGNGFAMATKMRLLFLSFFKIKSDSKFYNFIKRAQFYFSRTT